VDGFIKEKLLKVRTLMYKNIKTTYIKHIWLLAYITQIFLSNHTTICMCVLCTFLVQKHLSHVGKSQVVYLNSSSVTSLRVNCF